VKQFAVALLILMRLAFVCALLTSPRALARTHQQKVSIHDRTRQQSARQHQRLRRSRCRSDAMALRLRTLHSIARRPRQGWEDALQRDVRRAAARADRIRDGEGGVDGRARWSTTGAATRSRSQALIASNFAERSLRAQDIGALALMLGDTSALPPARACGARARDIEVIMRARARAVGRPVVRPTGGLSLRVELQTDARKPLCRNEVARVLARAGIPDPAAIAGWRNQAAHRARNPGVSGSNPLPATTRPV
jgi:hypothetical protein